MYIFQTPFIVTNFRKRIAIRSTNPFSAGSQKIFSSRSKTFTPKCKYKYNKKEKINTKNAFFGCALKVSSRLEGVESTTCNGFNTKPQNGF